jgi:hypothetical protein
MLTPRITAVLRGCRADFDSTPMELSAQLEFTVTGGVLPRTDHAYDRELYSGNGILYLGTNEDKKNGYSVRCVRD